MIIKASKPKLVEAVAEIKPALSDKPSVFPAASGILITAGESGVTFTATDLETAIVFDADMEVSEAGSVLVPKDFIKLVPKLPDDEITLEYVDERELVIRYGKSHTSLKCLNASNYPSIPTVDNELMTINISGPRVAFAASTDDNRPIFTGVLLDFEKGFMVCTDTHRLAMANIEKADLPSVIVPAKVIKKIDGEVQFSMSLNHVMFKRDRTTYISSILSGAFPNYQAVIPADFTTVAEAKKDVLQEVMDRTSSFNKDGLPVKLNFHDNTLEVAVVNAEVGQINEVVEVAKDGIDVSIAFNNKYLAQVLPFLKKDDVKLHILNPTSPAVIKEEGYTYLLLPIRMVA
jgi:DNA polymerase-3 subunit beta